MPIHDLFSKRQKRLRGDISEVLAYDILPAPLRVQIITILDETIGPGLTRASMAAWTALHDALAREYGVFQLSEDQTSVEGVRTFFLDNATTDEALDLVELGFRAALALQGRAKELVGQARQPIRPEEAIAELNARFLEHGVGYQFESGELIRMDSTLLHSEVVKPALRLLADPIFQGADAEFRIGYEHYRHGRNEDALGACSKALESTLKVICDKQGWQYDEKATAKTLLGVVFDNKLLPDYLQSKFASLRTSLESGVPTVRNRQGGHGRGSKPREVPGYLASYLLHLTAADILLLINAEMAMK